jgi:acetolactate synthase-1/2/3 large subunit
LPPSFVRATASGKPAIVELRIEPEAIAPNTTLSEIRNKTLKGWGS